MRQTGDKYVPGYEEGYAVESEEYEENGRLFYRPKGAGERLEREKVEAFEAAAKAKEIAEDARRQQIRDQIEREAEEEVERMAKAKEEEDDEAAAAAVKVKEEEEGGGTQSAQPAFLRDYLSGRAHKMKGQDDDDEEDDEEEGRSSNSSSARLVGERAALKTAGERRKEAKEKDDWGSYASVHRPGVSVARPYLVGPCWCLA